MSFSSRISNGWQLTKTSLQIINENKSLLLFPILSTASLFLILATFFGSTFYFMGDEIEQLFAQEAFMTDAIAYVFIFIYYLINYTIIVFFNAALIHCARKILNNEETTLGDGIRYAISKFDKILLWAIISATVGMILQMIQNKGKIGEFISSFLGLAWTAMTFFVVPILIYENKSVFASISSSANIVKEKWGESLTANISLGFFNFIGMFIAILLTVGCYQLIGVVAIPIGISIMILVASISTAAKTIFVAAVYNKVEGKPTSYFEDDILDAAFVLK